MIEQALYFILGVLVAGLLGLMVLPALWARAMRLSSHRLQMQVPLSMEEILAERDLLRADFAAQQLRLEQRLEHLSDLRAQDRAELGRKSVQLITLRERLDALEEEVATLRADLVASEAALGACRIVMDREPA